MTKRPDPDGAGTGASRLEAPTDRPSRGSLASTTSREDAASRVSAYVYGNVLALAALIALSPDDLTGPTGVAYVLGTGVSTMIAHVLGETAALRVRTGHHATWHEVAEEVRNALPIATSATVPVVALSLAWAGAVDHRLSLIVAIAATNLRLAVLGAAVAHATGEKSSRRTVLAGIGLAAVGALAATLKWQLTH